MHFQQAMFSLGLSTHGTGSEPKMPHPTLQIMQPKRVDWKDWFLPVLMGMVLLTATYSFSPNFRWVPGPRASLFAGDFANECLGGYMVHSGDRSRFYDVAYAKQLQHDCGVVGYQWDRAKYLPLVYPPFYYLLVSPLSTLPLDLAAWIWAAGLISSLVVTLILLVLQTGQPPWRVHASEEVSRLLPWVIPLVLLYMPVIENFTSSQKGSVCLLVLTATYCLMNRDRRLGAGIVFGLLVFKPQLTLVIAVTMFVKREWRFVLGMMSTATVFLSLSLCLGIDVCRQYVVFSLGAGDYLRTAGYQLVESHCLYGFFVLLTGDGDLSLARVLTAVSAAALILVLGSMLRGTLQTGTRRFAAQFAALVIATVLLSPHLFTYDLTILLLAMYLTWLLLSHDQRPVGKLRQTLVSLSLVAYVSPQLSVWLAESTSLQITVFIQAAWLIALSRYAKWLPEDRRSEPVCKKEMVPELLTEGPCGSS
ncbi:MAG: hypothetical protein CMJ81_04580 [Planctomycetaceae bacterium]|nr:hypothetical protein [Planctomycetaceae bacterium]